jgi:hypothetical protein
VGADAGVSLTSAASAAAKSPAAWPSPSSPRTLMAVRAVDMVCLAQETFRVQGLGFRVQGLPTPLTYHFELAKDSLVKDGVDENTW